MTARPAPMLCPTNRARCSLTSAYRGKTSQEAVRAKGGSPRVAVTGMWGRDEAETLARLEAWNQPIHRIRRGRIENIFGTWKCSYGLRRMRWRGLAKDCRSGLTAANQRPIAPPRDPPSGHQTWVRTRLSNRGKQRPAHRSHYPLRSGLDLQVVPPSVNAVARAFVGKYSMVVQLL